MELRDEVEAQRRWAWPQWEVSVPSGEVEVPGCLGGVGVCVCVSGNVPVRGRRQAAGMRSQRFGTQEMGGSRCRNGTRVRIQLDQGHFCHCSWATLSEVLIGLEKNCALNQVTAAGL